MLFGFNVAGLFAWLLALATGEIKALALGALASLPLSKLSLNAAFYFVPLVAWLVFTGGAFGIVQALGCVAIVMVVNLLRYVSGDPLGF